ncbi:MAG: Ig-like domain-containing protein [Bacteroidales bacterium]|nr:Ig-like domain-containing protein [Bacteroidales bacterium]
MKLLQIFKKTFSVAFAILFSVSIFASDPTWTRVNYTSSTAFIGTVKINEYDATFPITVEEGDYIGAFVGDECRMVAQVFAYDGKLYVSSVIHGGDASDMTGSTSEPEEVEFKVWDNSASKLVNHTVKGTLMTQSAGEIFDYIIGKPNTNSELESLAITSQTLTPSFSPAITEYEISVPFGATLPAAGAYTATALDSRAEATVDAATTFDKDGKAVTTITVTAEDGTKTKYMVTFVQEACTAVAPTATEISDAAYCSSDITATLSASFAGKSDVAVWYATETEKEALYSGNAFKHGKTAAGKYTFFVAKNDGTCESTDRLKVTLTIEDASVIDVASVKTAMCAGDAAQVLTATPAGGVWSGIGVVGSSFSPEKGSSTITYTVETDLCSASEDVDIVVTTPAIPTTTPATVELNGAVPELSATGTGTITWYSETNAKLGTGVTFTPTVSTAAEKVYTFYVTNTEKSCESEPVAVTLSVTACSTEAPSIADVDAVCEGSTDFPTLTATGKNIVWYDAVTGGKKLGTGATYNPTAAGTYYASQNPGCEGPRASVVVAVAPKPATPKTDATKACLNSTADYIVRMSGSLAAGATLQWYDENGVAKGTESIQAVAVTTAKEYTYSVEQIVNGCVSEKATATLTVNALPEPVVAVEKSYCSNSDTRVVLTADLVGGDFTIDDIIAEDFIPSALSVGSHTVAYAYEDKNGCYGESKVTFSVDNCEAPAVETITLNTESLSLEKGDVYEGFVVTITPATAPTTVSWSSSDPKVVSVDANGKITAIGAGKATITATSTYTATKSVSCEISVVAPVESVAFNNTKDLMVSEGSSIDLSTMVVINPSDASVESIVWAASSPLVSVVDGVVSASDVEVNTDVTITVTVTTEDGTSKSAEVTLTIVNGCDLSAPKVANATQSLCAGSTEKVTFTATGDATASWIWEDESGKTVSSTSSFVTSTAGKYFVYQEKGGCESTKIPVTLIENAIPAKPVVANVSVCEGEKGTFSADVVSIWYSATGEELAKGNTYSPATAGTYSVKQYVDGCYSQATTVTYSINEAPEFTATDVNAMYGSTIPDLKVTTSTANTVTWYYNNASVGTGSSLSTKQTEVGTYIYYVVVSNKSTGCASEKTPVSLQISDCDLTAPVVAKDDQSMCVEATTPSFTTSAANSVTWYSDAALTKSVATTKTFTPNVAAAGTYYYYVAQKTTCQSPATKVTLHVYDLPVVSVSSVDALTTNDAPVSISASPAGGVLSGEGVTGSKFDPTVGVGVYTISYTYEDLNGCSNTATTKVTVTKGITVDRTELGQTITLANNISTMYANDNLYPSSAKIILTQAIRVAQSYYDDYLSYTQAELDKQVAALKAAMDTFLASKIDGVDLSNLQQKIQEAITTASINESKKGTSVGNIPAESFNMLQNEIAAANSVLNSNPTNQAIVNSAVSSLQNAIDAFLNSEIKNELTKVAFESDKIYLVEGQKYTPNLILNPVGATSDYTNFTWTSSNNSVAQVYGSGMIEAKQAGSTAISVSYTNNTALSDRMVVVVTKVPEILSVEMSLKGDQLYLDFAESMSAPAPTVYSELYVYGKEIPMYNVKDVSLWPLNPNRIVISLGSFIDDPNDIVIEYKGNSLSSLYGAAVPNFEYHMATTAVDDIAATSILAYPSVASSEITIAGVSEGDMIQIVASSGKTAMTLVADSENQEVSVNNLKAGLYYVVVSNNHKVKAKASFIKK